MQRAIGIESKSSFYSKLVKTLSVSALSLSLLACSGKSAEEHVQQAQMFSESGDNQAAIVELKNAIQQNPSLAQARFELGKIYLDEKKFESAEKELSRALEMGYKASDVIPLLSQAYQRTGANVALSDLDISTAELTPVKQMEVGYRKLQSMLQLEKEDEANQLIDDLLKIDTDTVYKGLVQAIRLVIRQDFEAALVKAQEMRERAPLNRDVLNFTARMHIINNQMSEAAKVYEDYIKVAPDDIEIKFALANMLVEQGKPKKAEKYIDELMEINDQNGLLNQLKGVVRAAAGDFEAALAFSEKAVQYGKVDAPVRLIAGYSAYELAEFEKAVMHLSFVAEFLPDNHPGLRILAASQLQANMGDQTEEVLSRLSDKTTADASLFSRAGYELLKAGDEAGARKIVEEAEKISETADDLTRLGILKLSLNDVEGLVNLESAVDKAPESITAKTTLAAAYLATDRYDKAMELAREWQKTAPNAVEGYLLQAEIEQRKENYDAAEATLNNVASLEPDNVNVMAAQIRLLLRQNKTQEALDKSEKLLSIAPSNIVGLASYFAIKAQKDDVEAGRKRIDDQLTQAPDNVPLRMLAARAALVADDAQSVLDTLDTIELDRNTPPQVWPLKGTALLRLNMVNEAENHYTKWAELYPKRETAITGLVLVLDSKREYQKALDVTNKFLQGEDNLQLEFIRSYLLVMTNRVKEAKQALSQIDDQYKELPFLRGVRARISILENKPGLAIDDARSAFEATKNFNNMLVLLRAYDMSGKTEESYELVRSYSEQFPEDVRALLLLAEKQITTDSNQAIASYQKILEKVPNNFVVLNNLAYLLMENGDLKQAEELAKRAYEIQPDNVATADTYAQVLVREEKVEDALEIYKRVITDDVSNEEVLLNYIEALLRNGETTVASRRLERSSFSQPASLSKIAELRQNYDI